MLGWKGQEEVKMHTGPSGSWRWKWEAPRRSRSCGRDRRMKLHGEGSLAPPPLPICGCLQWAQSPVQSWRATEPGWCSAQGSGSRGTAGQRWARRRGCKWRHTGTHHIPQCPEKPGKLREITPQGRGLHLATVRKTIQKSNSGVGVSLMTYSNIHAHFIVQHLERCTAIWFL